MRLLEEFWYGNIEPTEYDSSACKEYKEALRLITKNEEKLQAGSKDEAGSHGGITKAWSKPGILCNKKQSLYKTGRNRISFEYEIWFPW